MYRNLLTILTLSLAAAVTHAAPVSGVADRPDPVQPAPAATPDVTMQGLFVVDLSEKDSTKSSPRQAANQPTSKAVEQSTSQEQRSADLKTKRDDRLEAAAVNQVPEPSSLALMFAALVAMGVVSRRLQRR